MQGSFDIDCAPGPDGSTVVTRQAISAPWHLSKPYWTGETLLIQAVNATAGIFAGDHLTFHVGVATGASVLLTSPSASRIHTMPSGEATLGQTIHVKPGAWLEWMPELFIPQRNCRYRQHTELHVEHGAGIYFVETLAPGRVAHGESLAFERLQWTTRVHHGGKLILAERYDLSPKGQSLRDLRREKNAMYFASALLVYPETIPMRSWQETVSGWTTPDILIGGTRIAPQAYLFRILAGDSESLRDVLQRLRSCMAHEVPPLRTSARKL